MTSGPDPVHLIFLSLFALRLLLGYTMLTNHIMVWCAGTRGSCVDYHDRQNAGRERLQQSLVFSAHSVNSTGFFLSLPQYPHAGENKLRKDNPHGRQIMICAECRKGPVSQLEICFLYVSLTNKLKNRMD